MTQDIRNPHKLPDKLYPAEQEFVECMAKCAPLQMGGGKCPDAVITDKQGIPVNVIRAEVICFFVCGGDDDHPISRPMIQISGAWIAGDDSCSQLNLMHRHVPYALKLVQCRITVEMWLQHMKCQEINLSGSLLEHGVNAPGLQVDGRVILRNVVSLKTVELSHASIGNLDCNGGQFAERVWLQHMKCQNIDLSESLLEHGVNAPALQVEGQVALRNVVSRQTVELSHARIGINLDCDGGQFAKTESEGMAQRASDYALLAEGIKVSGGVFLRDEFCAKGEVSMIGAHIGGSVECKNSKFFGAGNKGGMALQLQNATINHMLFLKNIEGNGMVDLNNAKAKSLYIKTNWEQFEFVLDGFKYDHISNYWGAEDPHRLGKHPEALTFSPLDLLGRRPESLLFSPQPYEQMAKVLYGMGYSDDARKILLEKERLRADDERTPWLLGAVRLLWDAFAGCGYILSRALKWMAFFIALGTAFFYMAARCDKIVPHQPAIMASSDYGVALGEGLSPMEAARQAFPDGHPEFDALIYSLDVFIPFFALHQEPFWAPHPGIGDGLWVPSIMLIVLVVSLLSGIIFWMRRKEAQAWIVLATLVPSLAVLILASWPWVLDWRWLTAWYWFEILAGWALTSIALLSITALLRPRKLAESDG